jgi:hypothetical protein
MLTRQGRQTTELKARLAQQELQTAELSMAK